MILIIDFQKRKRRRPHEYVDYDKVDDRDGGLDTGGYGDMSWPGTSGYSKDRGRSSRERGPYDSPYASNESNDGSPPTHRTKHGNWPHKISFLKCISNTFISV